MRKCSLLFVLIIFALQCFSSTITFTDGNKLTGQILLIRDGKTIIDINGNKTELKLDTINAISFDDSTDNFNGLIINDLNFSGYVDEFNFETKEATLTLKNAGKLNIKKLNVLKFWNVRQNTLKNESFVTTDNNNFYISTDIYNVFYGELLKIGNQKLTANIFDIGNVDFDLKYISYAGRNSVPIKTIPGMIKLMTGQSFAYESLTTESGLIKISLGFGNLYCTINNISFITGLSSSYSKGGYYVILNQNTRFNCELLEYKFGNYSLNTNFGLFEINSNKILSFLKTPPKDTYIVLTPNESFYGNYVKNENNIVLKSDLSNTDLKSARFIDPTKKEILADYLNISNELQIVSENKDFILADNKIFIFEKSKIKVFDTDKIQNLEKENIISKLDSPQIFIFTQNGYIMTDPFGTTYFSKFDKTYQFPSQIKSIFNLGNTVYLGSQFGRIFKSDLSLNTLIVSEPKQFPDDKNPEEIENIFSYEKQIMFITRQGKIFSYDSGKLIQDLKIQVKKSIFDNDTLIVSDSNKNLYTFNLKNMEINKVSISKEIFDLEKSKDYILISQEDKISVLDKNSLSVVKNYPMNFNIYRMKYYNGKLYLLTEKSLKIFNLINE